MFLLKAATYDCTAVLKWGITSRLFLFLLQVFVNNLITDHQGSMDDVFMSGYRQPSHHPLVEAALGGFDNWDSEHFIFIAEHGYGIHEQTMAFFPLFPFLIWFLSQSVFRLLLLFLSLRSVLLISGFVLNLTVFPFAALCLYLLTLHVSKDRRFSLLAAALFCINPVSVFMSAVYTECLFALFTFSGLLMLERDRPWTAAVLFMFATAVRSNGIVLCGYIGYCLLLNLFNILSSHPLSKSLRVSFFYILSTALQCILVALPFALFQYYGYHQYCSLGDPPPVWCTWAVPLPYSYIQEHYWNNGFLRYFQVKQIPNFLLATPIIVVSSLCVIKYFLGSKEKSKKVHLLQSNHMRSYVFHLAFLLLFGTFFMNVQVITRFICSSSPLVYWFSSAVLLQPIPASHKPAKLVESKPQTPSQLVKGIFVMVYKETGITGGKLLLGYFLLYTTLGFILHCNFYPWT